MGLRDVHATFAWVVIGANALAGVWALAANWLEPLRHRAMWWFILAAELAIFVQVSLGVLVLNDGFEVEQFHQFYGFVALITVGILYSYRQQMKAHRYLLYGFGSLFLMGLGLRAMVFG
jgi:FtsH-binding integral membrane protein